MRRGTRGAAYLVLGAAGAALIGWLIYAFTISVQNTTGRDRVFVITLAGVAIAVAAIILLSPPVRDAEVAMARPLLGVSLPPVRDRHSWASRWRGAAWAGLVLVVGALAAVLLLAGVPAGVGLAVDGAEHPVQLLWRLPLGIALVLGSFAIQAVFGWLLAVSAPKVLGPTPADRLALAADRERALARSNELARELHDTIGHSLTAISVQAEAGYAVGLSDPQVAHRALERISATAAAALEELDSVLGSLRSGPRGRSAADLEGLVHAAATEEPSVLELIGDWDALPDSSSGEVFRIVQEGLTNAVKHGRGAARVRVSVRSDVSVTITNAVARQRNSRDREHRGIVGLRERMTLVGGTIEAGPTSDGREWKLCARLPTR
ncbi:sensor histidine kinase [Flexivirga endophytica]|uniref:sensor histidine kinase n=1 Tax=Flexivirga endophytica TaxID=1849103 RepID=UPI00166718E8|nr:histidine kinase [Flexivirga endophytica]